MGREPDQGHREKFSLGIPGPLLGLPAPLYCQTIGLVGGLTDHDPVVVIVVGKDVPVRERHGGERRLIECVSALGGTSPPHGATEIEHFDGARMDVVGVKKRPGFYLVRL